MSELFIFYLTNGQKGMRCDAMRHRLSLRQWQAGPDKTALPRAWLRLSHETAAGNDGQGAGDNKSNLVSGRISIHRQACFLAAYHATSIGKNEIQVFFQDLKKKLKAKMTKKNFP